MRKIAILMSLLVLVNLSAFSSVSAPGTVPDEILSVFYSQMEGRRDADLVITDYRESDGFIFISYTVDGKERNISASGEEEIKKSIENSLRLEKALFSDGPVIFYEDGRFIASETDYSEGKLLYALDDEGKRKSVLMVSEKEEGVNMLEHFSGKSAKAGYRVQSGPVFSAEISFSTPLDSFMPSAGIRFYFMSLFKNIYPSLGFEYTNVRGRSIYSPLLSLKARWNLSSLLSSDFSMIRSGAVFADAAMLFSFSPSFSLEAEIAAGYEHYISVNLYYNIAYRYSTLRGNTMSISAGVLL